MKECVLVASLEPVGEAGGTGRKYFCAKLSQVYAAASTAIADHLPRFSEPELPPEDTLSMSPVSAIDSRLPRSEERLPWSISREVRQSFGAPVVGCISTDCR